MEMEDHGPVFLNCKKKVWSASTTGIPQTLYYPKPYSVKDLIYKKWEGTKEGEMNSIK